MTIYVGNGFGLNMIEGEAQFIKKPVTEAEFRRACREAKSFMGHKEIADHFGVPYNRTHITLTCGDTVYVVSPAQRINSEGYEFIKEDEGYVYNKVFVNKVWKR